MGWSPDRDLQGGADAPATLPLFNMYEQSHNTATVRNCIWFMHDVPIRWMLVDVHINGWFGTENCLSRLNDVIVHPTCLSINGNPACRQDYYERILPDVPSHCIRLWQQTPFTRSSIRQTRIAHYLSSPTWHHQPRP